MGLMRRCNEIKTVRDCIKSDLPSLGNITDQFGREFLEDFIKVFLLDLNTSVNLKRPLNNNQCDFVAYQIAENHRNIRLSDINHIFVKAKSGGYGELYERLSPDKILLWFSDYWEERMLIAAELSRDEHGQSKESSAREGNIMKIAQNSKGFGGMNSAVNSIKHKAAQGQDKIDEWNKSKDK